MINSIKPNKTTGNNLKIVKVDITRRKLVIINKDRIESNFYATDGTTVLATMS
jgi:hypothetical protein